MNEAKISPKALEDLKEIRDYIAIDLCNEQAAKSTVIKATPHNSQPMP